MKPLRQRNPREYAFVVSLGMACAFVAGYTNGVCLGGFIDPDLNNARQTVAGVTGAYTAAAIELADGNLSEYRLMVGTILSVMGGSCISSVLNPRPVAFELSPSYGGTFMIATVFSLIGSLEALHNNRREFFFTAVSNGIMNGVSSMYSANLLRTTHLTGTTTDIGLFLGQWLRGNRTNNWKLYILSGLATSFWLGSYGGYEASKATREYSLLFATVFFFVLGMTVTLYICIVQKVGFFDALFGLGKMGNTYTKVIVTRNGEEVPAEELLDVYDELDDLRDGHVKQAALVEALASKDMKIEKRRKTAKEILSAIIKGNRDQYGDFTVSRDDWDALVSTAADPAMSYAMARRTHSRRIKRNDPSAREAIAELRRVSMIGGVVPSTVDEEGVSD
ncbi:hypothetical protein ACHAWF_010158 [Thalassiosira exigua]